MGLDLLDIDYRLLNLLNAFSSKRPPSTADLMTSKSYDEDKRDIDTHL
jgi:hypothetical protein